MSFPNEINSRKNYFTGAGVAIVTPFTEEGNIDYASLERIVQNLLKARIDNIVLFGTTGESPTIAEEERLFTLRFMQGLLSSTATKLIVGFGGNNTAVLCDTLKKADLEKVDGILVSTPFYNKPTQEGLYRHYAAIAEVSPRPIVVYNIPGRTACDILPDTLLRLRTDFPEKIVATKDSTGRVERIKELVSIMDCDFTILSGDDCHTLKYMREGALGVISVLANAFPALVKGIVERACCQESKTELDEMDLLLSDMYKALFEDGNPAGIKSLLKHMGLIHSSSLRLPLVEVSKKVQEHIMQAYDQLVAAGL